MQFTNISNLETSLLAISLVRGLLIIGAILLLRVELVLPALLCIILFLISWISKWWSKRGLKRLIINHSFEPVRLFAGDNTHLKVQMNNLKFLPSIISWNIDLPNNINLQNAPNSMPSFATILKWHDRQEVSFEVQASQRGYYNMDNPHIISSDFIGISQIKGRIEEKARLIVYPAILPLEDLGIKASDMMGEKSEPRYILPDPIMVMGLREYTPEMPAYLINWKASAKQDALMAKLIEPSADYKFCITIDMEDIGNLPNGEKVFEKALSIAASIAVWADELGMPIGLLINTQQIGFDSPIVIPVNRGTDHILLLLEKLARANYESLGSWQDLLYEFSHELPWGTSIIVIRAEYMTIPNTIVIPAII